jgi:methionyl aminopeptidase
VLELKSEAERAVMREAGRVVAAMLAAATAAAAVGVPLRDLDEAGREVLRAAGAKPTFLGYHPRFAPSPYPAVLCTSVNDAALHGIPTGYRLRDGDLLSVDAGAEVDGFAGDAAVSVIVGTARPEDQRMLDTGREALAAGIAAAQVGARIGDISAAIGRVIRGAGYGLSTDYGGHGIGRRMHEEPSVPNEGRAGRGLVLRPGVVLAIEPWFMAGGQDRYRVDKDGWTLRSADGSRAVHMEHTVAIEDAGPEILTVP